MWVRLNALFVWVDTTCYCIRFSEFRQHKLVHASDNVRLVTTTRTPFWLWTSKFLTVHFARRTAWPVTVQPKINAYLATGHLNWSTVVASNSVHSTSTKTQQATATGVIPVACSVPDRPNSSAKLARKAFTCTDQHVSHTHAQDPLTPLIMTVACANCVSGAARSVLTLTIARFVRVDSTCMMDGAIFSVLPTPNLTMIYSIKDINVAIVRLNGQIVLSVPLICVKGVRLDIISYKTQLMYAALAVPLDSTFN